jgi:iron complex outermembrane receptor protein
MKKTLLALAVAIAMPLWAWCQFSINGRVTDSKTGEKLSGAHILINQTFKTSVSDTEGKFSIKGLKKGNYTLKVSFMGYQNYEKEVKLESDITLEIKLESKIYLEEGVIIQSTSANEKTPATYENISKEKISERNTGADIPFIIEQTPSVVSTSDAGASIGYTNLRIRGSDLTRTNVMINGIPLNDAESQGVWFVNMPDFASSVDNIQIQRGVGTSVNGAAAFGASINFQTNTINQKPYSTVSNTYGSFNSMKNTVNFGTGLINNVWSFDGRLSRISSDGFIDRASTDLRSFYLAGTYLGKKNIIKAITFSGKEKTYQAWNGVPSYIIDTNRTYNELGEYYDSNGNKHYYDNQTDNYQQDHYQLHFSHQFSDNLNANIALHYTKGYGYYEEYKVKEKYSKYGLPNFTTTNDTIKKTDLIRRKYLDNDFYGLTYSLNYNDKNRINLTFGGAYNNYTGRHFGNIIWMQYAGNIPINYEWYRNKGLKTDFNTFVKINYKLNENIVPYIDLQYRTINYTIDGIHKDLRILNQQHDFNFFNPKFGLIYFINDNSNAYISYAVAHREPNRDNFVDAPLSKPFPVAEKLQNIELGYELKNQYYILKPNIFFMNYKDQLVLTGEINDVGEAIMTNVPESYRLGLEITFGIKPVRKISWEGNISFSKNKIKNFTAYVDDWDTGIQRTENLGETDLSFSPDIIFNSTISYELYSDLNISLISKYVGKQYIDNTSNSTRSLKPYFVNNIRLNYSLNNRWFKQINLIAGINNIFDIKYETNAWIYRYYENNTQNYIDGYFPQAGRNWNIGLNLCF